MKKNDQNEMKARILLYMVHKGIWDSKKSIPLSQLLKGMHKEGFFTKPLIELKKKAKKELNELKKDKIKAKH